MLFLVAQGRLERRSEKPRTAAYTQPTFSRVATSRIYEHRASKATGFGSEPKPNRSSSVFLEDPKDSNPRFRAFFFGFWNRWNCRPPHLNTTTPQLYLSGWWRL